jgi:hypothetical protein
MRKHRSGEVATTWSGCAYQPRDADVRDYE